jgi:uncharacterized protein (DUF736 family)
MSHEHHEPDRAAQEKFLAEEIHRLSEANARLAVAHQGQADEIAARQKSRRAFVATCMDERTAHVEGALGLLPGEAKVFGSGGARLDAADFDRLYAPELQRTITAGACLPAGRAEAVVYLVTHLCGAGVEYGCAAFKSDVPAQIAYFKELKDKLTAAHPDFLVHVLMHDTANDKLEKIDADGRDGQLDAIVAASAELKPIRPNTSTGDEQSRLAHAAYGIYVGDAYRAWEDGYNRYFRLDVDDVNLAADLGIAFAVMVSHSTVDLATKPIVLHVDYPIYADAEKTAAAREAIDSSVTAALREPEAAAALKDGQIKVVKTETNMATWEGQQVGEPEFDRLSQ